MGDQPDPESEMVRVESNPDLTKSMIELCNTNTIATISHGIGSIESLNESLDRMDVYGKNLVIFHVDAFDYNGHESH